MSESFYIYCPATSCYLAACSLCIEEGVYDIDWVSDPDQALPFYSLYLADALIAYLTATKISLSELQSVPCSSV